MARVCIYNSTKIVDTRGNAINHALVNTPATPRRSKPVRLFTAHGELRYVSLEFIYFGMYSANLDLRFYLEFYGDNPSLALPPNVRPAFSFFPAGMMWARENNEIIAAGGVVTHEAITRTMLIPFDPNNLATVRWLPLLVHAPWMRLAIWVNGPIPVDLLGTAQLIVFAHVGGHLEEKYLEDSADTPYDYNASV